VLARVPIGLAVKNGAPHPDISSVEAFKRTLLDARSIAYVDPASGGTSASSWRRPSKSSASPPS
jgi:molybdate transport system substrate-binding protein